MEEIWRKHEDYEDYEFSNHGRFRSIKKNIILKNTMDTTRSKSDGYIITFLKNTKLNKRQRVRIHRMVGLLFVHNPDPINNVVINHIDGDKRNNHHSNLEWTTVTKNNKHALETGLRKTNFSSDQVKEIRELYINNLDLTLNELADKFLTTRQNIKNIIYYTSMIFVDEENKEEYLLKLNQKEEYLTSLSVKNFPQNLIDGIIYDYVNGFKINHLHVKYGCDIKDIKFIIKNYPKPNITLLPNEIFKEFNEYKISNLGRLIKNNRIVYRNEQFIIKKMAELFIPNLHDFKFVKIIDNLKPISVDNIMWVEKNNFDYDLYEELKQKYIDEPLSNKAFKKKYKVKLKFMTLLKNDVKPHMRQKPIRNIVLKPHLCKICGETDENKFPKKRKSKCNKCSRVYSYVKKPKREYLCKICGDNNENNFKPKSKGCCRLCTNLKAKEKYNEKKS